MKKARKVSKAKAKVKKVKKVKKVEPVKVSGFVPMDVEFESDWMSECGKEKGESWMKPDRGMGAGNVCEVRLLDGTVVAPCYLDGVAYARVDGEVSIPQKDVVMVRCYVEASVVEGDGEVEDLYSRDMDEMKDMMEEEL